MKRDFFLKSSGTGPRVLILLILVFSIGGPPIKGALPAETQDIKKAVKISEMREGSTRFMDYNRPSRPAAGVFLVAESHLRDPNFSRTVVLILQHSSKGSLGLIVNRPTSSPLSKIWPELSGMKEKEDRLFIGGPVQHEAFGMLYLGEKKKNKHPPVFDNVFYSNNSEHLAPIAKGTAGGASAFRVYAGYAGWSAGQLQSELQRGDWRLVEGFSDAIFKADPEGIWSDLMAESERQWIRLFPPDPVFPAGFIN
ncbi:MAG TPA: YqgE/AlgH family protein [Nitrospiria bacterium]